MLRRASLLIIVARQNLMTRATFLIYAPAKGYSRL